MCNMCVVMQNQRRRSNTGEAGLAVDTSPAARRHSIHVESPTAAGVKFVSGFSSGSTPGQAAPKVVGPGIVVLAAPPSMAIDPAAAFLPWQEDDVVQAAIRGERHWGLYVSGTAVAVLFIVHALTGRAAVCDRYRVDPNDPGGDSDAASNSDASSASPQRRQRRQNSNRSLNLRPPRGSLSHQRSCRSLSSGRLSIRHTPRSIMEDDEDRRSSFWSVAESIEERDRQMALVETRAKYKEKLAEEHALEAGRKAEEDKRRAMINKLVSDSRQHEVAHAAVSAGLHAVILQGRRARGGRTSDGWAVLCCSLCVPQAVARRKQHMAVYEQAAEEGRQRIKKRQKAEIERQDAAMKERLRQNVQRAKEREARRQLRELEEAEAAVSRRFASAMGLRTR